MSERERMINEDLIAAARLCEANNTAVLPRLDFLINDLADALDEAEREVARLTTALTTLGRVFDQGWDGPGIHAVCDVVIAALTPEDTQ